MVSSSVTSKAHAGSAASASARIASLSVRFPRLPFRTGLPLSPASSSPCCEAMSESESFSSARYCSTALPPPTSPWPPPTSPSTYPRAGGQNVQRSQATATRVASTMTSERMHPRHPLRFRPVRSPPEPSAAGSAPSESAAAGASPPAAASPGAASAGPNVFTGRLSSPHGASEGPMATAVVPKSQTSNSSSGRCAPSGVMSVTEFSATSSSNATGASEASASTMSHSSDVPTFTRVPAMSTISAPLIGPSVIFSRKFICVREVG